MVDDQELDRLARRSRTGDRAALGQLCAALEEHVWRYCQALLDDPTLAEDAAQDAFVRLVRALPGWRGEAPVRVFVLLLARRAVADAVRSEARHRRRGRVAPVRDEEPDAAGVLVLEDLMRGLPDDQRDAFALTQLVGLPYAEVAAVTGVPIGTVRSRVARARDRLIAAVRAAEEVR